MITQRREPKDRRLLGASAWLKGGAWVAVGCSLVSLGACRGLVAGDSINAVDELCSLLESCYPDEYDCSTMTQDLAGAEPATQQSFLMAFDPGCLVSCAQARACADLDPFCSGASCEADFDCCGWSRGELACAADGQCCKPAGQRCESKSDCCTTDCVISESGDKTCGGIECGAEREPCADNSQCCSLYCGPMGSCEQITCVDVAGTCNSDADCCDKKNELGDKLFCGNGICQYPNVEVCVPSGEPCTGEFGCCTMGEVCTFAPEAGFGVCGPLGCAPVGQSCANGEMCCGMLAVCLPNQYCGVPDCGVQGEPCQDDANCCSLSTQCSGGTCEKCELAEDPACHSVCETGGPLAAEPPNGTNCDQADLHCVQQVGAERRSCVCNEWDASCVALVAMFCAQPCTNGD